LLLAIAVILPTVCLLWFMSQAVKNERLAARQKLVDVYHQRTEELISSLDQIWTDYATNIETEISSREPIELFTYLVPHLLRTNKLGPYGFCQSAVIYDSDGTLLYPIVQIELGDISGPKGEFESAWQMEFVEKNFARALTIYEEIADAAEDNYRWRKAVIGQVRCLRALGDLPKARSLCHDAAYERRPNVSQQASIRLMADARVLLTEMYRDTGDYSHLINLIVTATGYNRRSGPAFIPMDSNTRIFLLRKSIEYFQQSKLAEEYKYRISSAKWWLAAEEFAAGAAMRYPSTDSFRYWTTASFHRLDMEGDVYGFYHKTSEKQVLLLGHAEDVSNSLGPTLNRVQTSDVSCRVVDNTGAFVTGLRQPVAKAFLAVPMGKSFPGWKVELYFNDAGVFEKAASKQVTVYMWAGILVIVLILAAGGFAAQAVGKQIRLNRLKNDFIATVSHELKTPLASMRVLVDTLLEGNYKDQKQAIEYLQLTAKENERLSRLIDNFLTFSRMERNKQAFAIVKTSPVEIARAAAEAVKTKFSHGRCEFEVEINEDLPDVLADHDAMVTVLINLLDNAYKYSYDDKHIKLRVFSEDNSVCFCVSDNGMGLSRRATKKIFKRFYQVDRSLSRHVEGCGLGLSIAKFIVDAHRGTISAESKPGEGSTFTVKLPVGNQASKGYK